MNSATVPWQDEWVENDPDGWSESLDLKCNRSSEWREVTVHEKKLDCWTENKYISDILHNFYVNFPTEWCRIHYFDIQETSFADPWHFGLNPDPDLDPRIHAYDKWIRILLFLS